MKSRFMLVVIAAVAALTLICFFAYVIFRIRVTYENEKKMLEMVAKIDQMRIDIDANEREFRSRLDDHDQAIYGNIMFKLGQQQDHRTPQSVPPWFMNFQKETRDRLNQLEWDHYRTMK